MEFPENVKRLKSVKKIVDAVTEQFPTNISKAAKAALVRVKKLKDYSNLVDTLMEMGLRGMIEDKRHSVNTQKKREAGVYGGPAKTVVGDSEAVAKVAESMYSYHIAGTMLGLVLGKDLQHIAESEQNVGNGHLFNSRLCFRLMKVVPEGVQVRDAVSEKKLRTIFQQVQNKV